MMLRVGWTWTTGVAVVSVIPASGSVFLIVVRDTTTGTDSVFLSAHRGDTAGLSVFVDARRDS